MFSKIDTYATDEVRPPSIFALNYGSVQQSPRHIQGWPSQYYVNSNSWHHIPCPVPPEATFVEVVGMFVGGGQDAGPFFFHVDVRDPHENKDPATAGDWSDVGGQGSFYYYYNTQSGNPPYGYANVRAPFGIFRWPVYQQKCLLRWKLDTGDQTGRNPYNNPFGINIWAVGYCVPAVIA